MEEGWGIGNPVGRCSSVWFLPQHFIGRLGLMGFRAVGRRCRIALPGCQILLEIDVLATAEQLLGLILVHAI